MLKIIKKYFVKVLTYIRNGHIILNYIKYTKYKKTYKQKDIEETSNLNPNLSEPAMV